jgi:hypothetical protein
MPHDPYGVRGLGNNAHGNMFNQGIQESLGALLSGGIDADQFLAGMPKNSRLSSLPAHDQMTANEAFGTGGFNVGASVAGVEPAASLFMGALASKDPMDALLGITTGLGLHNAGQPLAKSLSGVMSKAVRTAPGSSSEREAVAKVAARLWGTEEPANAWETPLGSWSEGGAGYELGQYLGNRFNPEIEVSKASPRQVQEDPILVYLRAKGGWSARGGQSAYRYIPVARADPFGLGQNGPDDDFLTRQSLTHSNHPLMPGQAPKSATRKANPKSKYGVTF